MSAAHLSDRIAGPFTLAELRARAGTWGRSTLVLGTFDGVHRGHQGILRAARAHPEAAATPADGAGTPLTVFTFDRLPLEVIAPTRAPQRLLTPERRYELLLEAGADRVIVGRFDAAFSRLPAVTFVVELLIGSLGAASIVVGYNHTFGYRGEGDPRLLAEIAGRHGVKVITVEPIRIGGRSVSSTEIRRLLTQGACAEAAELLGRPFSLEGEVVRGDERGRRLGFPTANLAPAERLLVPAEGVYLTRVDAEERGALGFALTAISTKPTFQGRHHTVESHILDAPADLDLYGVRMRVHFLERIRSIQRFAGVDALKRQIEADIRQARALLAQRGVGSHT